MRDPKKAGTFVWYLLAGVIFAAMIHFSTGGDMNIKSTGGLGVQPSPVEEKNKN